MSYVLNPFTGQFDYTADAAANAVSGNGTSTATQIPTYADATGKVIQASPATVDSSGNLVATSATLTNGQILAYSGPKNYIPNSTFENDTNGAAPANWFLSTISLTGTTPTRLGAGGTQAASASSISSFLVSNTSPLSQTKSLVVSTTSGFTAGQGFSTSIQSTAAINIDVADRTKILNLTGSYAVTAGASTLALTGQPATNTFALWLYDQTNDQYLQPSGAFTINSLQGQINAFVQIPVNCAKVVVFVIAQLATTGAATIQFDDLKLGPQNIVNGFAASDLKAAGTLTIGATTTAPTKGTVSTDIISWGRVGDHAHITGQYKQTAAGSSAGTGDYLFTLPNGMNFDTSKVSLYTTVNTTNTPWPAQTGLGSATISQGGTGTGSSTGIGVILPFSATQFRIGIVALTSNGSNGYQTGVVGTYLGYFITTTAALSLSFDFMAPILGWSSNVAMSSDSATNVVSSSYQTLSSTTITSGTPLKLTSPISDQSGLYNAATGAWTVTVPGLYQVCLGGIAASSSACNVYVAVNGTNQTTPAFGINTGVRTNGSTYILPLNAGQAITLVPDGSITTSGTGAYASITRISGPSAIAATETIAASYYCSANTTAATTAFNFDTKIEDTHGAVTTGATTWRFTAPAPGLYNATAFVNSTVSANTFYVLFKNGSAFKTIGYCSTGAGATTVSSDIRLVATDYIDIRPSVSQGTAGGALATAGTSNIAIKRIGL